MAANMIIYVNDHGKCETNFIQGFLGSCMLLSFNSNPTMLFSNNILGQETITMLKQSVQIILWLRIVNFYHKIHKFSMIVYWLIYLLNKVCTISQNISQTHLWETQLLSNWVKKSVIGWERMFNLTFNRCCPTFNYFTTLVPLHTWDT